MNRYIYSGRIPSDNNETSLVDILIASDELELLEVYHHFEKILLEDASAWKLPKDFITLCQYDNRFYKLYYIAIELVCKKPKLIFESKKFLKMKEDHLIRLLKCDNLKLEENEIWKYLIKWGIENTNSILNDDLKKWTSKDFMKLEKTLHNCIPHIRFSQMSSKKFNKVKIKFKSILPEKIVDNILQYFSD